MMLFEQRLSGREKASHVTSGCSRLNDLFTVMSSLAGLIPFPGVCGNHNAYLFTVKISKNIFKDILKGVYIDVGFDGFKQKFISPDPGRWSPGSRCWRLVFAESPSPFLVCTLTWRTAERVPWLLFSEGH